MVKFVDLPLTVMDRVAFCDCGGVLDLISESYNPDAPRFRYQCQACHLIVRLEDKFPQRIFVPAVAAEEKANDG